MNDKNPLSSPTEELELGWDTGRRDARLGQHCKFNEAHSEFAVGYYGGYYYEKQKIEETD